MLCIFQRSIGIVHWPTKEGVTTCHPNISHSGYDGIEGWGTLDDTQPLLVPFNHLGGLSTLARS